VVFNAFEGFSILWKGSESINEGNHALENVETRPKDVFYTFGGDFMHRNEFLCIGR